MIFTQQLFGVEKDLSSDSLSMVLKKNGQEQNKKLIELLYRRFYFSSGFDSTQNFTAVCIEKYDRKDAKGLIYFFKSLIHYRKSEYQLAKANLVKSISMGQQTDNHLLLFHAYTNIAFVTTDEGDITGAIEAYKIARKHAILARDPVSLAKNSLGVAMIYNDVQLYTQALAYLNRAENAVAKLHLEYGMLHAYINYYKAEIYFKMTKPDSLQKYSRLLGQAHEAVPIIVRMQDRAKYLVLMLAHKQELPIPIIKKLLAQKHRFDNNEFDRWNLTQIYYKLHLLDSAKATAAYFLKNQRTGASPQKFNAIRLLAQIAVDQKDIATAITLQKKAMLERDVFVSNLLKVGDVSAKMDLDELESSYVTRTLSYQREHNILMLVIATIIFILIIIGLAYRNIVQKRNYEKLLTEAKTEELAMINSHQVRKHLANIMGICDLLKHPQQDLKDLEVFHDHLRNSAASLDEIVKVVAQKLTKKELS